MVLKMGKSKFDKIYPPLCDDLLDTPDPTQSKVTVPLFLMGSGSSVLPPIEKGKRAVLILAHFCHL